MNFENEKHRPERPCPIVDVDGVIEKGKQFDIDINLPEDNRDVIYGVIRNCFKEPVSDAVVKLIEIDCRMGKEERKPVSHTFTDKDGEFVFGPLCPGKEYAIQIWVNDVKHVKVCAKCFHEGKCLKGKKIEKCDFDMKECHDEKKMEKCDCDMKSYYDDKKMEKYDYYMKPCFEEKKEKCDFDMKPCYEEKKEKCDFDMKPCYEEKKEKCDYDMKPCYEEKKEKCDHDMKPCYEEKKEKCDYDMKPCYEEKKEKCDYDMKSCYEEKKHCDCKCDNKRMNINKK